MSCFLSGIEEKYPKQLLKGRIEMEGNVISCLMKDMLLIDETHFESKDFVTIDGRFYFSLLKNLRSKGFFSLDEVTILSNIDDNIKDGYLGRGGWDVIQKQIDIINEKNFDTFADILYRENIMMNMVQDGFNLINPININGKKVTPLKMFRKMTADEVTEWYEARLSSYGTGYSNKVLEEEEIDFDDEYIESCAEGEENGVPFENAGFDKNGELINAFPFLSKQIGGFLEGTLSMMGGFSSAGKSTWWITIIMALVNQGKKVLIISNEETVKKYKSKFMVWMLARYDKYFKLTKKKFTSGDINDESREHIKNVQKYWRDNYKGKIKFISIADADMNIVKKKTRENVLRYGYNVVLYDTFKIEEADLNGKRTDLSLVQDSRELHKLAKKYNIIMLASIQLAEYMKGKLFLDASVLSNCKQVKEILENLFLMRTVYPEEIDPKNKLYCHPFQLKHKNDKWIEEPYVPDPKLVWRMVFVEKGRGGANSSDTGVSYLYSFDGEHSVFREKCQARSKHGEIK